MDVPLHSPSRRSSLDAGPWLWGARVDLTAFGGSAALALGLVALGHATGLSDRPLPEWAWVAFVLGVDVAHVWSTLFRTYLDGEEVRRHRARYLGIPLGTYAIGVGLYLVGARAFWCALAYLAIFHFVRQQVGWVAIYRARADDTGRLVRWLDDATVYASTLYPLVHWHASVKTARFAWFMPGDLVDLAGPAASVEPWVRAICIVLLAAFALRHGWEALRHRRVQVGKVLVVATTAATWYVGIVGTNSDFDFTVTNVVVHGVPYLALVWAYGQARRAEAPQIPGSRLVAAGPAVFLGLVVALAFIEELAWDRLVWHDRPWLFGESGARPGALALALIVPLLAVPQATHYVVDGFVWRRKDSGPAQRAALGFAAG